MTTWTDLYEMTVSGSLDVSGVDQESVTALPGPGVRVEAPDHHLVGGVAEQSGDGELSVWDRYTGVGVTKNYVKLFVQANFNFTHLLLL